MSKPHAEMVDFTTANEIRIPVGHAGRVAALDRERLAQLLWVPNLAGKLDMVPGRMNRLRLVADGPGLFRGQCAEFCGTARAGA